ncbi:hypothetical protein PFISCL1PPCAC_1824, partial [Pristionchus fissidentatus]
MSDHEDLDYGDIDAEAEQHVNDEEAPSNRHARVEFPSDEEEEEEEREREERTKSERERRWREGDGRRKKMPWTTEREEKEERIRMANQVKLTFEMQQSLYRELKVDLDGGSTRLDTVIVKGADKMGGSQLEKIFGDFFPYKAEMADTATGLVYFRSDGDAAKMMIGMTKRLRRVRVKKAPEEGEVRDESDEEEGELKQEGGDDVAVEDEEVGSKVVKEESVEINVDDVSLPEGKWRVVTQHVPDKKLMLVRFASHEEIMAGRQFRNEQGEGASRKRRNYESEDGYKYTWMEEKTRAGLNIFDKEGNELDWDYEHDTRFYEDVDEETKEEEKKDEEVMAAWPAGVKVRGRGAKSARFGINDASMKSDESPMKRKREEKKTTEEIPISRRLAARVTGGVFDDNDDEMR